MISCLDPDEEGILMCLVDTDSRVEALFTESETERVRDKGHNLGGAEEMFPLRK